MIESSSIFEASPILSWNANWMGFNRSRIGRYVFREKKKKKTRVLDIVTFVCTRKLNT